MNFTRTWIFRISWKTEICDHGRFIHGVLLEFSEGDSAQHIRERVYNVLSCGYEPIIAHVSAIRHGKSVGFSSDLVDMGARLQVNVESILGKHTWGQNATAEN